VPKPSGENMCGNCGYDFDGIDFERDPRCPECGRLACAKIGPYSNDPEIPTVAFVMNALMLSVVIITLVAAGPWTLTWSWFLVAMTAISAHYMVRLNRGCSTVREARRLRALTALPGLFVIVILIALIAYFAYV